MITAMIECFILILSVLFKIALESFLTLFGILLLNCIIYQLTGFKLIPSIVKLAINFGKKLENYFEV